MIDLGPTNRKSCGIVHPCALSQTAGIDVQKRQRLESGSSMENLLCLSPFGNASLSVLFKQSLEQIVNRGAKKMRQAIQVFVITALPPGTNVLLKGEDSSPASTMRAV
jgi:hypothetical protein